MKEIKVLDGQNLFDIAIQNYGSLEAGLFKLLDDNNLSLDSKIEANQSLFVDENITNSNKYTIDEKGNRKGTYIIKEGDRIAQMVFMKYEKAELEIVNELDETKRGKGGFGHSGY